MVVLHFPAPVLDQRVAYLLRLCREQVLASVAKGMLLLRHLDITRARITDEKPVGVCESVVSERTSEP